MAFTYNADLSADRDKLRRAIGDVTEDSGVLPTGSNFTDAELDSFISEEGTWQRAVAYACEALANAWATSVTFKADGVTRGGTAAVKRADGYSKDLSNIQA